jgi:hypothetical protein
MPWNSHHQLVLGGVSTRAFDEFHRGAGAGEFLDQQCLVGELAGQPVRGVTQHHIHSDPGDDIAQPLQRRANEGGPGVSFVFEDPLGGDVKLPLLGVRAQRRGLRCDRLVFLLPC